MQRSRSRGPLFTFMAMAMAMARATIAGPHCESPLMPLEWVAACEAAELFYAPLSAPAEPKPQLSNGRIGTLVGSDSIYSDGLRNGDSFGKNGSASVRARIPSLRTIVVGDAPDLTGTGRALDVARAQFLTRRRLCGGGLSVHERWFAHATRPWLLIHEINLTSSANKDCIVEVQAAMSAPSDDLILAEKTEAGVHVMSGHNKIPETNGTALTHVAAASNLPPCIRETHALGRMPLCAVNVTVRAGSKQTLLFLTAVLTSIHPGDSGPSGLVTDAINKLHVAMGMDADALFAEHAEEWARRLAGSGAIHVVGDWNLSRAVNASLYALRTEARADGGSSQASLSPGGLSTNGYKGHLFWDMETWMLPPLLLLEPDVARALLQYRWARNESAAHLAAVCGKDPNTAWCPPGYTPADGALRFPWESALSGLEVQYEGGHIGAWGRNEVHISADIALACASYFFASGDLDWLRSIGFPLIRGVSSFFAARLSLLPTGGYGILHAMGPDEYAQHVDNSQYTVGASLNIAHVAYPLPPPQ